MSTDLEKLAYLVKVNRPIEPEVESWWAIIALALLIILPVAYLSFRYQQSVDEQIKQMTTTTTLQSL